MISFWGANSVPGTSNTAGRCTGLEGCPPPNQCGFSARPLAERGFNGCASSSAWRAVQPVPLCACCAWRVEPAMERTCHRETRDTGWTLVLDLPGLVCLRSRTWCRQETDWEGGLNRTPWLPPANAATLPFQCVGQLISCIRGFVIHVIPRGCLAAPWPGSHARTGPTSPAHARRDRKVPPGRGFRGFFDKYDGYA
jgi:hypothetical protein